MRKKIDAVVPKLITEVFPASKIKKWREEHPCIEEMKSKKWSPPQRFRKAYGQCLAESSVRIEQEFQIKVKTPRPIIQTGDRGQVWMLLPVKCFEELLFEYFESASIKHMDKKSAMMRVAKHLRMKDGNIVEGDGSAWDPCCNLTIRKMTENRIMEHIIEVLGEDAEVPAGWMQKRLLDMEKKRLKGKAKVDNSKAYAPFKVLIESIRQSGHRGTSAFNWLINLVCWLCILCEHPDKMIAKNRKVLEFKYVSAQDGKTYILKFSFEGDDSAISTTEVLDQEIIEQEWTRLGFRMKLVFVKEKMTFTGYDSFAMPMDPWECRFLRFLAM